MRASPRSGFRLGLTALALVVGSLAACAHAPPVTRHGAPTEPAGGGVPASARVALDLGARGRLLVDVPPGWTATPGDAQPPVPATLRLDPPTGHVLLLLTPLWDPALPAGAPAGERGAHTMAELARQKGLETALEREVPLRELGGGVVGWWFAVTDRELAESGRAPGPEEYRALLQGAASVGGLVVAFTLLDDGDGPHRAAALALVRRVRHQPAAGSPDEVAPGAGARPPPPGPGLGHPPRGGPDDPAGWREQGAEPALVTFPGKAWSVTLSLPGFRVRGPDVQEGGARVHLVAHEEASGLVASLVLTDAAGRTSARACADADWERIGAALGGPPAGERRADGERVRADYLVASQGGERVDQQNLSAWWYRDGVCVHAHVSLMGFEPGDQPRLEQVLAGVAFAESL